MRLVEMNAGPRTGLEAAGYWWRYVITTPNLLSELNHVALIGGAVLATLVLPRSLFKRVRQGWGRVRNAKTGK
jgi:hypothetical protein